MINRTVKIYRHWQDENQTFGNMVVFNEYNKPIFSCSTIERGWRDNARNMSCVPTGEYPLHLERSPRFNKDLWELKDVPGRFECKIHVANSWHELNGCIALGIKIKDIDRDGYVDVTFSGATTDQFHKAMKGNTRAKIIITDSFK